MNETLKHTCIIMLLLPLFLCGQKNPQTISHAHNDSVDHKIMMLDKILAADTITVLAVSTGGPFTERNSFYFYRSGTILNVECTSVRPYEVKSHRVCTYQKQLEASKITKLKALLTKGIRLDSDLYGCGIRKDFAVSSRAGTVTFKDLQCLRDDIWKPLNKLLKLTCEH